jgi:hypothetical protein
LFITLLPQWQWAIASSSMFACGGMADAHEGYMIYRHGHVLCINMFVFDLDPNHKPIRKFIIASVL